MQKTSQKRSRSINLQRMRKTFSPKPLALGISSIFLAACSDNREQALVFTSVNDCLNQLPERAEQCHTAYEQALQESARTSPKYNDMQSCEYDFGMQQCTQYRAPDGGSWFMPFMAGFMVSKLLSPGYYSQPLYTSYSRYSPYRYRWIGADGYAYGDYRSRSFKVREKAFTPKPTVSRTIKRGGFGSTVRAKSSWGSSKKGWGG